MKKRMMIVSILGLLVSVGSALGIRLTGIDRMTPCRNKGIGDLCSLSPCKPGEMCAQIVLHGLCDASLGCKQPGESCDITSPLSASRPVKGTVVRDVETGKLVCKKGHKREHEGTCCTIGAKPPSEMATEGKIVCDGGKCQCQPAVSCIKE